MTDYNQRHYKILVAAEPEILFGSIRVDLSSFRFCSSVIESLEILSESNYDKILIQADKISENILPAITAIKTLRPNINIQILSSVYDEYRIKEICTIHKNIIENYHIYPLSREAFEKKILGRNENTNGQLLLDAQTGTYEDRIRILEKLATEDDLTGAKNRRYLLAFLSQLLARAKNETVRVTILLFDIDNFKQYNDSFGHSIGDKILRQVAVLMRKCLRKQDIVARIGGDEFVAAFWDCPELLSGKSEDRRHDNTDHPKEAIKVATRFVKEINSGTIAMLGPKGQGKLTISGGLSSFPRDGKTIQELFDNADKALLEAKRQGKNQIYIVGEPDKNKQLSTN